jgi:Caspase domain
MWHFGWAAFLWVFSVLAVAPPALAERRVALVIGNGDYSIVGKLANPTRDASAVEALLKAAGFDAVDVKRDLGRDAMRRALRDFSDRVRAADIAVLFFAGHGIEVNGTNYLIPVDAVLERDIDVEDETVSLDRVTQILEPAKRLRLVILDACRDNPFVRSMRRTVAGRSIGRGLGRVEVLTADTLIAFAAKAGSTAADGDGANSPYTTALVKHLTTSGLDLRLALGRVRDEVLKSTGNRQEPFVYGSLGGAEVTLAAQAAGARPPPPAAAAPDPAGEAERAWLLAKDTTDIGVLEAFMARYRNTFHAELARARIDALRKQQTALVAPPPLPKEPPKSAPQPDSGQRSGGGPVIAAAGTTKRFTVELGKSVELTPQSIVLSVREPDLQKNSVGVRVAGRGSRWGAGQEFPLTPYGGGSCRLALLEVKADAATFLLRC